MGGVWVRQQKSAGCKNRKLKLRSIAASRYSHAYSLRTGIMRTDRLTDVLSTNLEPVKRGRLWKALLWALVVGLVAAFVVMLATVGVRSDFAGATHQIFMALKLLFTLSLIGTGALSVIKSMRPAKASRTSF